MLREKLFMLMLVATLATLMPMILIWCLNVLLGTTILFTLETWFAALLIIGIFSTSSSSSK